MITQPSSDPIKRQPRQRVEAREDDILTAAASLFAEKGFHGTSTRQIAAAAGVSEGTVYHYFESKNTLLETVLSRFYQGLIRDANDAVERELHTRARLERIAANHIFHLSSNNFLGMRCLAVYFSAHGSMYLDYRHSRLYELNRAYTKVFDAVIKEGIMRGELDPNLSLSVVRDLYFGGLEYSSRTLMSKKVDSELAQQKLAKDMTAPVWVTIALNGSTASITQPGTTGQETQLAKLEQERRKLEAVCERLETLSGRLADN